MVLATTAPAETSAAVVPGPRSIVERRIELIELAVELEVDREDFIFHNTGEEALWDELVEEFEQRTRRLGRVWLAD